MSSWVALYLSHHHLNQNRKLQASSVEQVFVLLCPPPVAVLPCGFALWGSNCTASLCFTTLYYPNICSLCHLTASGIMHNALELWNWEVCATFCLHQRDSKQDAPSLCSEWTPSGLDAHIPAVVCCMDYTASLNYSFIIVQALVKLYSFHVSWRDIMSAYCSTQSPVVSQWI